MTDDPIVPAWPLAASDDPEVARRVLDALAGWLLRWRRWAVAREPSHAPRFRYRRSH